MGGGGFLRNHGGVGTPDMVHLDVGDKIWGWGGGLAGPWENLKMEQ
jgi:hypothetical protein